MEAFKHYWTNNLEENLQHILKVNAIYSITDAFGRIEYANQNFCEILGYKENQLIGEAHELLKSELHSSFKYKNLWKTIKKGQEWRGILNDESKQGKSFWLDTRIIPIKDDNENNFKFLSIYEDISTYECEIENLKKETDMYRLIYNSIKIGIIVVTDHNGIIIKWNKGAENAFGYSQLEILGKPLSVLMATKYRKTNISEFLKLLRRYTALQNKEALELKCLNKEGEEFPVEFIISDWNIDGNGFYVAKMFDITKRKAFHNRLKQKTKELELLLYRSAHDLKAPFISAKGLIKLIKEEQSIEKVKILTDMLEKTIDQAKVLSEDLSSASLISTKIHELKVIDFSIIIDNVLKMLQGYQKFENIKFNIDIKNSYSFISNPDLVFAVFQNLIQNAIKYSSLPTKDYTPYIDIKVTSLEDETIIKICDNGLGIDKKEFKKIFELYYRTELENSAGSTGLGLFIVKNIIESLNGKINVESQINKGTCFRINLPNTI